MNATTVAVDLAKSVFELVAADAQWRVLERARLTRSQFERWFHNRAVQLVVMEACATAHYWARTFHALASVPGIGLLTSTVMVAAVADPRSFSAGRRYSSFLGLTPREFSSGNSRYLGRISKRGDRYVRSAARAPRSGSAQNLGASRPAAHQSQQGDLRPCQ